jgi:hypothetical protein
MGCRRGLIAPWEEKTRQCQWLCGIHNQPTSSFSSFTSSRRGKYPLFLVVSLPPHLTCCPTPRPYRRHLRARFLLSKFLSDGVATLFQPRPLSKLSSNRRFSFPLISPVVPPLSHISLVRIRTLIIVPCPPLAPLPAVSPVASPSSAYPLRLAMAESRSYFNAG